jgi:hypothetical protein
MKSATMYMFSPSVVPPFGRRGEVMKRHTICGGCHGNTRVSRYFATGHDSTTGTCGELDHRS